MLLACSSCHRQYDVGALAEGERIRCLCGTVTPVPRVRSRQVEMLHCSNCGGRLEGGASACAYCSAEVKLADRGLGPACPECFAQTLAGARYCGGCGVRIQPQAILRALASRLCPRCQKELELCESEELRFIECTGCGGLWLDEELFERIARERDAEAAAVLASRGDTLPGRAEVPERGTRYLPCPACGELMHRKNFASCSGVILDWCKGHGWWFDAQELQRVLDFVQAGGLERSRERVHELRKEELRRLEQDARGARAALPSAPRRTGRFGIVGMLSDLLIGEL